MTKTLVEMFKGNASIRYDAFDLAKNPQNNLTENLRNEVGSKHTSKHCTFIICKIILTIDANFGNAVVKIFHNTSLRGR